MKFEYHMFEFHGTGAAPSFLGIERQAHRPGRAPGLLASHDLDEVADALHRLPVVAQWPGYHPLARPDTLAELAAAGRP